MPLVAAADLRIHVHEWRPTSAPRAGAPTVSRLPIVMLHGNWSTHRWWRLVAEQLGDRHMFAPDLRGRGDTIGPDHGYTLVELADDLRALLDALGLARAHLVGHSLGTGIIMQLALTDPERVASLVAIAPVWPDGMPAMWARADRQDAAHADRELFGRMVRGMAPKADPAVLGPLWDELIETGHQQRQTATRRNLDALMAWRPGDALRSLTMPRVVIDGGLDILCGGETARRTAELMNCERVTLDDIGHSPILEAPAAVARVIERVTARGDELETG